MSEHYHLKNTLSPLAQILHFPSNWIRNMFF